MIGARRLRAAALALCLASATFGGAVEAAPSRFTATLDGESLGAIVLVRAGGEAGVALAPLAHAAGWRFDRRARAAVLAGDDRVVELTIGSRAVREDGESAGALHEPLTESARVLYVSAPDAARIFGLRVAGGNAAIAFSHPARLDDASVIDEVAKPRPKPRPSAVPMSSTASATAVAGGAPDAGRVVVSLERTGGIRMLRLTAESHTGIVQTAVDASGVDRFATPNATVQIGGPERGAVIGLMGDPLSGDVVGGGVFDGAEYRRHDLGRTYFAGRRLADGLFETGVTSGDPLTGATTIALVRDLAGQDDVVARRAKRWHHAWGDFTAETMMSEHGAGIGASARTAGRTFLESRLTLERGLPVGPNEQPLTLDVGRHLSDVTTVAGGVGTSGNGTLLPFAALSSRIGALSGSVALANGSISTSLSASTPAGSLQAFATAVRRRCWA